MSEAMIMLADTTVGDAEIAAVTEVLRSRWLSAGPVTRSFELEFAAALGVGDAVAVSSGTAALHLAMLSLDLRPGDQVIVPSLTFVAGAAVVALHGATPVFADVRSPDDLTIDPADVARLLNPAVRAVVATHYAGRAADLTALRDLLAGTPVTLVEDAAHAPVVAHPAGALGTVGDVGCFSFFATKNLTTGEGGMVVAADPDRLARIRRLRSHSLTRATWERSTDAVASYDVDDVGLNYRPTEIASAIGRVQLGRLPGERRRRAALAARYRAGLGDVPGLGLPGAAAQPDEAHHLFPVLLPDGADRDAFRAALWRNRVQTSVHYQPIHHMSLYRRRYRGTGRPLPVLDALAGRLVSLPLHALLSDADADHVVHAVRAALTA
ncbi:DegT/DnrJ/EryC1/StrS family aminotransferase [Dactylosporangium sp. NPDC005572]|uniref:DegT/DnrJ/EryC1/StrS family aminotransferase n=1 Tax=Dactylosporangium sp. NPDC005572 TaxID=3156889 RepID=UPI0033A199F9